MKANSRYPRRLGHNRPSRILRRQHALALAIAGVLLTMQTSCTQTPPPAYAPPPRAYAPPPRAYAPPPATADWRDAPLSAGAWHWAREAGVSVARFDGGVMLACAGGRVSLSLAAPIAGSDGAITITTSDRRRSYVAPHGPVMLSLPAQDPILDAMAFSRGLFMVEVTGQPRLIVPAWAEVGRVIEDCRAG